MPVSSKYPNEKRFKCVLTQFQCSNAVECECECWILNTEYEICRWKWKNYPQIIINFQCYTLPICGSVHIFFEGNQFQNESFCPINHKFIQNESFPCIPIRAEPKPTIVISKESIFTSNKCGTFRFIFQCAQVHSKHKKRDTQHK